MSILLKEFSDLKKEMIDEYYNNLNDLEKHKFKELNSILKIQKKVRKYLCVKRFRIIKEVALEIQKNLKGYFARIHHKKKTEDKSDKINENYFLYHLIIIQKACKGFLSRKYHLDYRGRKKYLKFVSEKNEEMSNKLEEYARSVQFEREKQKEENTRKKFNVIGSNLHHLVSTKAIPGVYNPPHLPDELKSQIYNADIETHLKTIFKLNYKKTTKLQAINNPSTTVIKKLNTSKSPKKTSPIRKNISSSNKLTINNNTKIK